MDKAINDMKTIAMAAQPKQSKTQASQPTPTTLPTNSKPPTKSTSKSPHRSLMTPSGPALSHPAAPLLQTYSDTGCPANCGPDWSLQRLDEAIQRGAHASAKDPAAADALMKETMEQVDQGFARIVP
jgi:hypothetical protein